MPSDLAITLKRIWSKPTRTGAPERTNALVKAHMGQVFTFGRELGGWAEIGGLPTG